MSILVSAAVLITVAYARPFVHYAQFEWQETWLDGAYTHAWLAIAVLAWLVYRAGGQDFRLRQARASWTAWGLLGLGAATKCAAVLLGHATLDGLSLVPLLLGLSGVLLPDEAARRLRFPILFLLAIVPVPNLVIDLSLVGPRPPVPSEVDRYSIDDRRRLDVTPGLTCIWQVSGRSTIPFEQQVQLDVAYIESQSLWLDLVLLARTIPAVLSGRGAF